LLVGTGDPSYDTRIDPEIDSKATRVGACPGLSPSVRNSAAAQAAE
jgi:hypothetical protein